ncbi:MAG: DUF1858 domain-containing protein [Candidatus Undinarchaeales archaeon]
MTEKNKKFDKDTKLEEVLTPEYADILVKYKMPCIGCPMARMEAGQLTLGQIGKNYGLDLEGLLKDLNEKSKELKEGED